MRTPVRVILALLSDEQMLGSELVQNSGGLLKRGVVYVHLDNLERQGLVEVAAFEQSPIPGLYRRRYGLTATGERRARALSGGTGVGRRTTTAKRGVDD